MINIAQWRPNVYLVKFDNGIWKIGYTESRVSARVANARHIAGIMNTTANLRYTMCVENPRMVESFMLDFFKDHEHVLEEFIVVTDDEIKYMLQVVQKQFGDVELNEKN